MVWRRHQDQLRQHSVIDSEATHVIAPSVSISHYCDLMGSDDSTDSASNETEESRPVKHPPPHKNPKHKCAQPYI